MENLFFELPVGLRINGEIHTNVELLSTNGVAEKIFLKRLSEKPYTWQGNVVSAAVKSKGTFRLEPKYARSILKKALLLFRVPLESYPCPKSIPLWLRFTEGCGYLSFQNRK